MRQATATAATPSPRPVSPRPSVVVAERLTCAPSASVITRSPSARCGAIFGLLPITCTETEAIEAGRAHPTGRLLQERHPAGPCPLRFRSAVVGAHVS